MSFLQHYTIAWIGIQIIHFKKFDIPVSTGTSKGDKSLNIPSGSISDSVMFRNFLGGMPPDPPSVGMLCMLVCFTHYESTYPS